MYRFCNMGHCIDFNPRKKIHVNPAKPPINNLEYYQDYAKHAKNKAVFVVNENGYIIDHRDNIVEEYNRKLED